MASPTVRRRQLSAVLRQMRQSAGLSLDAVAARLEWSRAKVGHIETGQRERPSVVEVKALMAEYGVTPDDPRYETVLTLTRQAQARGWWRRYDDLFSGAYIELEAEASEIRVYEAFAVPGLLQTPGYARLLQQARLDRAPDGVERADVWCECRSPRTGRMGEGTGARSLHRCCRNRPRCVSMTVLNACPINPSTLVIAVNRSGHSGRTIRSPSSTRAIPSSQGSARARPRASAETCSAVSRWSATGRHPP